MTVLTMDNIPPEIYKQLLRRAQERQYSVQEEAMDLLRQGLQQQQNIPTPRLPDLIPSNEITAPCDLPRPKPTAHVPAHPGQPRLPDPVS